MSTRFEYTSNKKFGLKNTYAFGRSSDDRETDRLTSRKNSPYMKI